MAYELFLNVPKRPSHEEVELALTRLSELPELEACELHELEDVVREPAEYAEDLEWLLQVEAGLEERYQAFCERNALNGSLEPPDPQAAARFMEELAGFDFAVVRFPDPDEAEEGEEGEAEARAPDEVAGAWRALVGFARKHGYRLMDPQFNDPGQFIDLGAPGELPPAYEAEAD